MNTFQIVGFILLGILGIIVFLFLISYIAMIREWNHIKSGDKGIYTDGPWISGEFTVIHKTKKLEDICFCFGWHNCSLWN